MLDHLIRHAKILIVDDELGNVRLLEKILGRAGYEHVSMTTDSRDAVAMFADDSPDLVLLDLHMPHQSGYDIMKSLGKLVGARTPVPIIVLTADSTPEAKHRALSHGASDVITKPLDNIEVILRIKNVLGTRFLQLHLENQNQILDERVRERTAALQTALTTLRNTQDRVVQQERLHALGMMTAGVGHDFNNVLSLILGYGELLLNEYPPHAEETNIAKYVQTIIGAAQDGARMVGRLAEFQRPLSAQDLHRVLPLDRLVAQVIDFTRPRWKEQSQAHGVNIEIATDLVPGSCVAGQSAEIRELLTNLIFNAVDAMPHGGTITVRTCCEDKAVLLEVEDTGTGMTDEVRARCLEPFFSTKGEKGSGLGLAMIYGIVKRHGGSLEIESRLGQGTKFQIRLPGRDAVPARRTVVNEIVGEPLDILVVDDQEMLREILVAYLQSDYHRVSSAGNGAEAIEKFKTGKFDLVITDQAMPGMSGEQLAAALREIRSDICIMLLTGFASKGISASPTPAIDAVIGKPVDLMTLRQAIARAILGPVHAAAIAASPVPELSEKEISLNETAPVAR